METCMPGKQIFKGMLGNPAPAPTSQTEADFEKSKKLIIGFELAELNLRKLNSLLFQLVHKLLCIHPAFILYRFF